MIDKISLKKIIVDFNYYSNNLINTSYEECDVNFKRLKKYIDENELIRDIVQEKIKESSANYENYFLKQGSGFNSDFLIPEDENDHIKSIYDYMDMIEKSNTSYFNIASLYICSSNKLVDIIHNFNQKIIYPLINYINIELSKKMMEYDDIYPVINFNGNNSPVYFQSQGNQNIEYINNDLSKINNLISEIITSIAKLNQNNVISKEELIDELKIMQETLNSSKPNFPRIKRAFAKVQNAIAGVATTITGVANNLKKINRVMDINRNLFSILATIRT